MKTTLSSRISLGYIIIIAVASVATLYCIYILQSNKKLSSRIQAVNLPVYLKMKDLIGMNHEAEKLTNEWIYQPSTAEKSALQTLMDETYPALRENINHTLTGSEDSKETEKIKSVLVTFDRIITDQRKVMQALAADSLYANDAAVDQAISLMDRSIAPQSATLNRDLAAVLQEQEKEIQDLQIEKESADNFLTIVLLLMIVIFLAAAVIAYVHARRVIIEPIVRAKNLIVALGQGRLVNVEASRRTDELGEMMEAMRSLTKSMDDKVKFAETIGQGNYKGEFTLVSNDDVMGRALLDMRESLKDNAEEEYRRNWSTQGLAEIGVILRKHTLSPRELYESVTRFVVKYVNANQGGIFLLAGEHQDHLELAACYAYDRKKYMEKIIAVGDGLLGQCVLEKQTINLLAVPRDYIRITSGLGDALPTNILIVPLKVNDQVEGVLELASFHKFEPYQIAFLEKLGESIAAAIAGIQVNKKTRDLLDQTQEQAEQMKASQEELRQSMEELSATQEEMSRKEREYIERINALENAVARQAQLPHLSPNGREKNLLEHRQQIASNF